MLAPDGTNTVISDPLDGPTRLCMSCHDGTIALDNAVTIVDSGNDLTGTALLDTDLSNDHPVGFNYDAAQALDPTGLVASTENLGLTTGAIGNYLYGGVMTCASCHDVHDASKGKFLLEGNDQSALCLGCHNK